MHNLLTSLVIILAFAVLVVGTMDFLVRRDFFLPLILRGVELAGVRAGRMVATLCLIVEIIFILVSSGIVGKYLVRLVEESRMPSGLPSIAAEIGKMGGVAIAVVVVLLIMSVYSIAIMIERYLTYSAAKKQSGEFVPVIAEALEHKRVEEAMHISSKEKDSYLAVAINAGLGEFRAHERSEVSREEIEASKRALQRAIAIKTAEFKRGLSGLATIGSTAPFVGLFGTVFGIINAFRGMTNAESSGIAAVAGGISEALFTTALGLLVAVPAVWLFNYFSGKIDALVKEVYESASSLIENYGKQRVASKSS